LHKANAGEQIAGVALDAYTAQGVGEVSMFVHPEWNTEAPQGLEGNGLTLQSGSSAPENILNILDDQGQSVASIDNQGNATFAGTITADKIQANQIVGLEVLTDKHWRRI
jgi:hypothetical protein